MPMSKYTSCITYGTVRSVRTDWVRPRVTTAGDALTYFVVSDLSSTCCLLVVNETHAPS